MTAVRELKAKSFDTKSHYVYSRWISGKNGTREATKVVPSSVPPPLLNNCIYNPATKTYTVFSLAWDLDAHRASPKWKDEQGRLDWNKMAAFFEQYQKELHSVLFSAVRSTGGKGLALWMAVPTFELSKKTGGIQSSARRLQEYVIRLLNSYGMGADPAAVGLKRDFCSYKNLSKTIFLDEDILRNVQKEKKNIITELGRLLAKEQAVIYRKRGDRGLLHKDVRVEAKLAKLYVDLEDSPLQAQDYKVNELEALTGASENFIRRFLVAAQKGLVSWLGAEKLIGHGEGFALQLIDKYGEFSARANTLLEFDASEKVTAHKMVVENLAHPSEVADGERNHWLTSLCLQLKWAGISENEAWKVTESLIRFVPGREVSRSCQNARRILSSIYLNRPELFGVKTTDILPSFVFNALYFCPTEDSVEENKKTDAVQKIESCLLSQKGTTSPCILQAPVVFVVRCFGGWGVWKCRGLEGVVLTLVGKVERPLVVGDLVEARGQLFSELNEWDREVREFKADSLISRVGFDVRQGLEGLPQMGEALARRVYSKFGEESFKAIRTGKVLEIPKIGPKKLSLWCEYLTVNF